MNFSTISHYDTYWCDEWPAFWPGWYGGNEDFVAQEQPFWQLNELRMATMLEF